MRYCIIIAALSPLAIALHLLIIVIIIASQATASRSAKVPKQNGELGCRMASHHAARYGKFMRPKGDSVTIMMRLIFIKLQRLIQIDACVSLGGGVSFNCVNVQKCNINLKNIKFT